MSEQTFLQRRHTNGQQINEKHFCVGKIQIEMMEFLKKNNDNRYIEINV